MDTAIRVLATWGLAIPVLLVAASVFLRRRWRKDALSAVAAGLTTIVLVKLAALHYGQRPFVVEHIRPLIAHIPDNSFPSDHLAAIGLAYAYLWPRSKVFAVITLLAAILVGGARVAAHIHWPVDVIFGFCLGIAGMLIAAGILSGIRSAVGSKPPIVAPRSSP